MGRAYEQHLGTEPMVDSSLILVSTVFVLAQLWHTQDAEHTVGHHLTMSLFGFCAQVGCEVPVSGEQTKQLCDRSLTTGGGLVRLAGIEPTTLGFGGQYSIH